MRPQSSFECHITLGDADKRNLQSHHFGCGKYQNPFINPSCFCRNGKNDAKYEKKILNGSEKNCGGYERKLLREDLD